MAGPETDPGVTGLEVEDHDDVRVLRINRPRRRNALSPALITALRAEIERLEHDGDVRAVVITGDEVAFSSGADLKEEEPQLYTEEINAAIRGARAGGWPCDRDTASPCFPRSASPWPRPLPRPPMG